MKVSGISLVILVCVIVLISGVSAKDADTSAGDSVTQAGNLHLQNPTTRRILEIIASSPEVSRKDIAEIVGIAGPSISWHTKRLFGDGIITTCKKGRAIRYTLCPAGADIFKRFRGQEPGMAPGSAAAGEEPGK